LAEAEAKKRQLYELARALDGKENEVMQYYASI
jgi:hypothetical protein